MPSLEVSDQQAPMGTGENVKEAACYLPATS
jgi:hypothetical protein